MPLNFTPPLRGSRRGRAVCAKADSVGGAFLWHVPPPTRLRASPLSRCLAFPSGSQTLKGGVKFGTLLSVDFFNSPLKGRVIVFSREMGFPSRGECLVGALQEGECFPPSLVGSPPPSVGADPTAPIEPPPPRVILMECLKNHVFIAILQKALFHSDDIAGRRRPWPPGRSEDRRSRKG